MRCLVSDLGADANLNLTMQNGATPFHVAAQQGNLDAVRYLVNELGANVNQVMQNGGITLYIVAQEDKLDFVRCLVIELGADVDQFKQFKMDSRPCLSPPS